MEGEKNTLAVFFVTWGIVSLHVFSCERCYHNIWIKEAEGNFQKEEKC